MRIAYPATYEADGRTATGKITSIDCVRTLDSLAGSIPTQIRSPSFPAVNAVNDSSAVIAALGGVDLKLPAREAVREPAATYEVTPGKKKRPAKKQPAVKRK